MLKIKAFKTSVTSWWLIALLFSLQTLAALPDQDSFYDLVDGLEEQGMETVSQRHLGRKGTDLDLVEQLNNYEVWDTQSHKITRKISSADICFLFNLRFQLLSSAHLQWIELHTIFTVHLRNTPVLPQNSHVTPIQLFLQMSLRHEDGDDDSQPPPTGRRDRRRVSLGGGDKKCGLERRRSRRASLGRPGQASPRSPASPQRAGFHPFKGQRAEDTSERWETGKMRECRS